MAESISQSRIAVGSRVKYSDPMRVLFGTSNKDRQGVARVVSMGEPLEAFKGSPRVATLDFGIKGHRAVRALTTNLRPVWKEVKA